MLVESHYIDSLLHGGVASPHPTIPDESLTVTSRGSLHHTLPQPQPHTTYSLQTELCHQITNLLLGYSESVRIHSHLWKNWHNSRSSSLPI